MNRNRRYTFRYVQQYIKMHQYKPTAVQIASLSIAYHVHQRIFGMVHIHKII